MPTPLCAALLAKTDEQLERTMHLVAELPAGRQAWTPGTPGAFTAGQVLGHLLECCSGFCAALHAAEPARLARFLALKVSPEDRDCAPSRARERLTVYQGAIREGFAAIVDDDLSRSIPTVFVPAGEPLLTLLLGNLEHLVNHKHQLFMYLQLMGVKVGSADLYRFRGGNG